MNVLGIEFAPLRIPLERRLQTAAVIFHPLYFFCLMPSAAITLIYLLFTKYYILPLLYAVWFAYDRAQCRRGGRRIEWFRRMRIWDYFRDYFPIEMVKTAELDPNKNYIMGYHPHGILYCHGEICCFATEATDFSKVYPGITPHLLTLEGQFYFPIHRDIVMASGACSVGQESIEWLLAENGTGHALVIVVGGTAEMPLQRPGQTTLFLKNRKGFVRLALKHGASLVPVFAFGESDIFKQVQIPESSWLSPIQNLVKKYCNPLLLLHGRGIFQYNFGLLPYRKPNHVVIGKPIDIQKIPEPTDEDISKIHNLYVQKLTELFEEHKLKYNPKLQLIIN